MNDKLKVLYYAVNQQPELIEIDNDITAMQDLVGGYIECVSLEGFNGPAVDIVINEEGKLYDLTPNRILPNGDYIAGNFFVYGYPDEEGNSTSIPESQVEAVKKFFSNATIVSA